MDLQIVCRGVMDDVDGALGCVLTDLETGLPLAAEYRPGTVMDANTATLVSHIGIDLFRGKLVRNFEHSLSRDHPSANGFVREVQLTTSNTYQFMSAVPGWDQVIFILVTNKNVSLGMGLLAVHDAVRRLEEMPTRSAAPAVNPTFQPRDETLEPSSTPQWQARQPEPRYDGNFVAQRARSEPQPEPLVEPLARTPATPETRPVRAPTPGIAPEEPTPHPSESPEPPVEAPEAAADQPEEAAKLESQRYYRGAATGDAETETNTPSAIPIGPRARMFFKRPSEDRKRNRKRRS